MHFVSLALFLVLCVTPIYSVTISSPPMQRKIEGEDCQFRWKVTGNFTNYTVRLLPSDTALGWNTNLKSSNGVITLLIWDIQPWDAGYYSLSVNTGSSTEANSTALLFVYCRSVFYSDAILAVGPNPGYDGNRIELNCSTSSCSLPAAYRPKMYYFWNIGLYGNLRNASIGPAVLENGDVIPGYSIKNDGKTLVIDPAQFSDNFSCTAKEEGSNYQSYRNNYLSLTVYGRPRTYWYYPVSRRFSAPLSFPVSLYFYCQTSTPLTSYTNWSFVSSSGNTAEYPGYTGGLTPFYLYFPSISVDLYGNYAITLNNSYGSTTEHFQILPPGPPDPPSNFSVQYMSSSRIFLLWRCMSNNGGEIQTVNVRLTDVATNTEIETRFHYLGYCYNLRNSTLFERNIQPDTNYEASIWSTNTYGSSNVTKLGLTTPIRVILRVSPSDISIVENDGQATINFVILNSTTALIRLNVTCCVEVTAECTKKSYILSNTDNQIVYDMLPAGTDYVFDFNVFDTDGYTYEYDLAVVKGVRVSTLPATGNKRCEKNITDSAGNIERNSRLRFDDIASEKSSLKDNQPLQCFF